MHVYTVSCSPHTTHHLHPRPQKKTSRDRLAAMKQEAERRQALERQGHGSYSEISEGEFLEVVTKSENVVCHFYHKDFERCKIVDKHMELLSKKYLDARFIKVSAPVRLAWGWGVWLCVWGGGGEGGGG